MRVLWHSLVTALLLATAATAQEKKPAVPPGRDPGGVAVALVAGGIDYTLPAVAARLARDGEGELIGWDLVDNDRRPFDRSAGGASANGGGDATMIASFLADVREAMRLVPVRVSAAETVSVARGMAFAARTPARIVLLVVSTTSTDWEPVRQAAIHFKDILFIVPAGNGKVPAFPVALGRANVLAVVAGSGDLQMPGFGGRLQRLAGPPLAVAAAGRAAAAILAREPHLSVDKLKAKLVASERDAAWQPLK